MNGFLDDLYVGPPYDKKIKNMFHGMIKVHHKPDLNQET